jgi:histidinol-phosphate aminotransferase
MNATRTCIREMTGYVPGESALSPDTVKLNQNENRYAPSDRVAAAIAAAAGDLSLYPDSTSTSLRRAAAEVYGVLPDQVMATNGSDEMLRILFQTYCDPGDEAVSFRPGYTYYGTLAAMQGARLRLLDFEGGEKFQIPAKLDFGAAKLIFLCTPNAPTGTVFPASEVRRVIESAAGSIVVVDEAYADFSGQTSIPLVREYPNVVVVRTFSKAYSLAGLRAGLGFAPAALFAEMEKVRDYYNVDRLAQAGAEAALRDSEWLSRTTGLIIAARGRTTQALREMGVTVYDSGANFILARFPSAARAEEVWQRLREANILTRYFKTPGMDDCIRVSIGTDADMDAFLAAMRRIL